MPSNDVSRRRILAGAAALVGTAGCLSDGPGSPTPSSPARTGTDRDGSCGEPVGDRWDSVDEEPTPPPCPTRPDPLRTCPAREYALGLEKHLRYARANERYDAIRNLEFGVYGAAVSPRDPGVLVHADLFFGGNAASGTPATGTPTAVHFDDAYAVSYLVTADGQWRATDRTGDGPASRNPRRDGSPVSCYGSPPSGTDPGTDTAGGTVRVEALSVSDFVRYPLAGVHPHVHRRGDTQYVVVRADTSLPFRAVRDRLALELDGGAAALAERQPVPWEHETVDVAFAVPKGDGYGGGRVLFDGVELRSLPAATVDRLNAPPVFEVSAPSASPDRVRPDERTEATVRFAVENTGEGSGTFGASLSGNLVSGSRTVTATVDPGGEQEVTATVGIVGEGDAATVRLDWGSGEWSTGIPVAGRPTDAGTSTPTAGE